MLRNAMQCINLIICCTWLCSPGTRSGCRPWPSGPPCPGPACCPRSSWTPGPSHLQQTGSWGNYIRLYQITVAIISDYIKWTGLGYKQAIQDNKRGSWSVDVLPVIPGDGEAGDRAGLRVVAPLEGGVGGELVNGHVSSIRVIIIRSLITFARNTNWRDQV